MGGEIEVVPFGKYKGRPVYDLMADESYCEWLAAQPWFRQRYGNVYNLIVNQVVTPQDTPEHNALQARFLDHSECLRLHYHLRGSLLSYWERTWGSKIRQRQRDNLELGDEIRGIERLSFETSGWDVHATSYGEMRVNELGAETHCHCGECGADRCRVYEGKTTANLHWSACYSYDGQGRMQRRSRHCVADCPAGWTAGDGGGDYLRAKENCYDQLTTAVELKPVVGDDYPTVLRQVLKRMQAVDQHRWNYDHAVVLADRVEFSGGVTLQQVKKIFKSQRVRFLLLNELPETVPDSWRCACDACSDDPDEVGAGPSQIRLL